MGLVGPWAKAGESSRWGWSGPIRLISALMALISPFWEALWEALWPVYCSFLLFSFLTSGKPSSPSGSKLGTVFSNSAMKIWTNQWPGRILEKGGKDSSYPVYTYSQVSLSLPDSSPAKPIKFSWCDQNAFVKEDNNSMSCLSCLKGSSGVFLLTTLLIRFIWGWLVSFSQPSSVTSVMLLLSTQRWHRQLVLFHSQSTRWTQERIFHLGPTGKDLDFVGVAGCLSLLGCK